MGSGYWKTRTRLHPTYACHIAGVMQHTSRCGRHLEIYPVIGGEYRLLIYPKLFKKQQHMCGVWGTDTFGLTHSASFKMILKTGVYRPPG
jgi:hypothetical protein